MNLKIRSLAFKVVARGYAIAVFSNADVDPDNFDDFKNGIHGLLDRGVRQPDAWGTIEVWAWGARRNLWMAGSTERICFFGMDKYMCKYARMGGKRSKINT